MEYNPFLPEVKANPYPYYAQLRQHAPVYQVEGAGMWAVSRYDDVLEVLKSPDRFSSKILMTALLGDLNPVPNASNLIASDPPVHTRLRKLVNRGFTRRMIAALEPRMRAITTELLAPLASRGACDLVHDLSTPLPVIVIAEMLGVEPDHRGQFKRWSDDIVGATNGVAGDERKRVAQSIAEFRDYFQRAIELRRTEPKNDLITALVRAEEEQQMLTSEEVLSLTTLLLIAGNETTTNLIGNAMIALLDHPETMARVSSDPTLIPKVVEEALRYDGPVQGIFRQATEDVNLAGARIPAGAMVLPLFASADRDERQFPNSEQFDIDRNTDGHLAFGFGTHFCLGAPLARLEAKIALEELLARFHRIAQKEPTVTRIDSFILRGPKTLPLTLEAIA
ncbi:MAG: cytochrome P450 [Candidatus Binatus sp.]|uniref:cytochrome P450 n=1 Tax=Candidatus Binatus sp. TaxID=2811406 RepID=UPI00271C6A34|nr:cytochrome P450 [Candidatus Binatus sp.]MDO8435020.1 cytochrome P450 [Candidatus Binatus sp.]